MGYITQNYQKEVLQAIFKEANELGYTVFCFANFGAYGDKVLYAEGERGIMYLPDLTQLDGCLLYTSQGYHSKKFQYFCYAFYPVHMLILALVLSYINR